MTPFWNNKLRSIQITSKVNFMVREQRLFTLYYGVKPGTCPPVLVLFRPTP